MRGHDIYTAWGVALDMRASRFVWMGIYCEGCVYRSEHHGPYWSYGPEGRRQTVLVVLDKPLRGPLLC